MTTSQCDLSTTLENKVLSSVNSETWNGEINAVKCGCTIQKRCCFVSISPNSEVTVSSNRFDVIGIALEDGKKGDIIKVQSLQLY